MKLPKEQVKDFVKLFSKLRQVFGLTTNQTIALLEVWAHQPAVAYDVPRWKLYEQTDLKNATYRRILETLEARDYLTITTHRVGRYNVTVRLTPEVYLWFDQ